MHHYLRNYQFIITLFMKFWRGLDAMQFIHQQLKCLSKNLVTVEYGLMLYLSLWNYFARHSSYLSYSYTWMLAMLRDEIKFVIDIRWLYNWKSLLNTSFFFFGVYLYFVNNEWILVLFLYINSGLNFSIFVMT